MRDRSDDHVLATLDRELEADPALHELAIRFSRLARCRRRLRRGPGLAPPVVLAVGLALMLLGCLALSIPVAVIGILTATVALASAIRRGDPQPGRAASRGRRRRSTR